MSDNITCVVCQEVKCEGKFVVPEPTLDDVKSLLSHAKSLVDDGNTNYHALANENVLPMAILS